MNLAWFCFDVLSLSVLIALQAVFVHMKQHGKPSCATWARRGVQDADGWVG